MGRGFFVSISAAVLAAAVAAAALSGCGAGGAGGSAAGGSAGGGSGGVVTVRTAEELLEAVRPGAEIVVESGTCNLSAFAHDAWAAEGEGWNESHPYVQLRDCYDGMEAVIQNVDGLTIRGQSADARPELVIDPRYGTVLSFENCTSLKLENLVMGHTDGGVCSGNVLNLESVTDAELRGLDLYGCGEVGMECWGGTGGVAVYDSVIHDCSTGPLVVYDCGGPLAFYDCAFTDSWGGGYYDRAYGSELSFIRCSFGVQESSVWAYADDVVTEDCTWSMEYPDGGEPDAAPEPTWNVEALAETAFDAEALGDTGWTGYLALNPQTGVPAAIPSGEDAKGIFLLLRRDGTGSLAGYLADTVPFLWEWDSEHPSRLTLATRNYGDYQLTLYKSEGDSFPPLWMSVSTGDALIWLY